jgi:hypothetical protein
VRRPRRLPSRERRVPIGEHSGAGVCAPGNDACRGSGFLAEPVRVEIRNDSVSPSSEIADFQNDRKTFHTGRVMTSVVRRELVLALPIRRRGPDAGYDVKEWQNATSP